MNAADQRRLTPRLGLVCVLLAALWLSLLLGLGRGIHWLAPSHPPAVAHADQHARPHQPPPLNHYSVAWQHPLFSQDRQPVPIDAGKQGTDLNQLQLTGIILTPSVRVALLTRRSDGHTVRVREGEALPDSGWVLKSLEPHRAKFVNGDQIRQVGLKVQTQSAAAMRAVPDNKPTPPSNADPHGH